MKKEEQKDQKKGQNPFFQVNEEGGTKRSV